MRVQGAIVGILAALAMTACTLQPTSPGARSAKAATDAQQPSGASDWARGIVIPLADHVPVTAEHVLRFGERGRLDSTASISSSGEAGFVLVYESAVDGEMSAMGLRQARSVDGMSIGTGYVLPATDLAIAGAPSLVRMTGRTWLYLIASDSFDEDPKFLRIDITDPGHRMVTELPIARFMRLGSWPRVVADGQGRIGMAFRNRAWQPSVAYSRDGITFDTPRVLDEGKSAMVQMGPMTGGGWLLSYQQPDERDATRMKTLFRVSADGEEWSTPARIARPDLDVHDAFTLPRSDRGADLYYVHRPDATSIALYRRAVFAEGMLGPEQQLTASSLGEALKPTAHRLQDGRILVTYAAVIARGGPERPYPSEQQLTMFRLEHDAPAGPPTH